MTVSANRTRSITWRVVHATATAVMALLLSSQAQALPPEALPLYDLVAQRLGLMVDVAAYKWRNHLPIEDLDQETLVIERATADALRYGLMPGTSQRFFRAQIQAAKEIQAHWFAVWQASAGPAQAADLKEVVRPELLRLGEAIVRAAAATRPEDSREAFATRVQVAGLSPATREALFDAIVRLERFPDRLAQILSTGVLRIGTTGDYQPFSLQADEGGPFSGIDIDLGRDLAAALGVTPQFVKTSWPTLLDDLAAGSYDIAMSGVSRTLARQRRGFLSRAYYVGGKTPVARCADAAGLNALAAIDRPGVRVIVNPGGTNQSFADANIHRAEVILHKDNRTIFQQLLDGNADVMITDRIEVELQAALHPELCATMAGDLTYQEKAFLMPQDPTWQAFVATWLDLRLADGTVAAAFAAHGVTPAPD